MNPESLESSESKSVEILESSGILFWNPLSKSVGILESSGILSWNPQKAKVGILWNPQASNPQTGLFRILTLICRVHTFPKEVGLLFSTI